MLRNTIWETDFLVKPADETEKRDKKSEISPLALYVPSVFYNNMRIDNTRTKLIAEVIAKQFYTNQLC